MNALLPTNAKCLALGLTLYVALACSAQASEPAPQPEDGAHATSGGSSLQIGNPNPTPGTAGTQAVPSGGHASTASSAGSSAGGAPATTTAGTAATGTAGTAATGTADTATSGGASSGGALAACPTPPAAGTMSDLLIDDLEDKDNALAKVGGRSGFWYTYLDTFGSMITPKPDSNGSSPLLPGSTNCHGGMACIIVSGTTGTEDAATMKYPYAGVGFDFSNAKKPCVYNGSAYSGIKFWARGDVEITIKVNIKATADAMGGGSCTTGCSNGHGKKVVLTPDWAQIDLPFASIMQDPTWGTQVPFDKATLLSMQVQFPSGGAFNAALDDLTFY